MNPFAGATVRPWEPPEDGSYVRLVGVHQRHDGIHQDVGAQQWEASSTGLGKNDVRPLARRKTYIGCLLCSAQPVKATIFEASEIG